MSRSLLLTMFRVTSLRTHGVTVGCKRKMESESGAVLGVCDVQASVVSSSYLAGDSETQPSAARVTRAGAIKAGETFENTFSIHWLDTWPVVDDLEHRR